MARDLVAKVTVKADVKSAERSIAELEKSLAKLGSATKKANAEAASNAQKTAAETQAAFSNIKAPDLKPADTKAYTDSVDKAAAEATKALGSVKGSSVTVTADASGATAAAKAATAAIDAVPKAHATDITASSAGVDAAAKAASSAIGSVPTEHKTSITADSSSVSAAAKSASSAIAAVPTDHATKITADASGVSSAAKAASSAIGAVPTDHATKITADASGVSAAAKAAASSINAIPTDHATKITGDASGIDAAAARASSSLKGLPEGVEIEILADSSQVASATARAISDLKGLPEGVEIEIIGDAKSVSSAAKKAASDLKAVQGKSVKIEADGSRATAAIKKVQNAFKSLRAPAAVKIEAKTAAAVGSVNKLSASYAGLTTAMGATTVAAASSSAAIAAAAATNATAASANNASASIKGLGAALSAVKGPMLAAAGAVAAVGTAISLAMDGAKLRSQTEALKRNVEAQEVVWEGYLETIKKVAKDQISTADIIKSSSQALLLGIPADKIAALMDVARVSAVATGAEIGKAFDDLAVGIGRASPMILDNLGLVIKLGEVNEEAAAALGKTVEELTAQEKKLALLNSVLETGAARILLFNDAQNKSAAGFARMTASMSDFVDGAKSGLSEATDVMFSVADGVNTEAEALHELNVQLGHSTEATEKAAKSTYGFYEILSTLGSANVGAAVGMLTSRWAEYNNAANKASAAAATLVKENEALSVSIAGLSSAQQEALKTEMASVDTKNRSVELTKKINEGLKILKDTQDKANAAAERSNAITERAIKLQSEESGWLTRLTTDYRKLAEAQISLEEVKAESLKKTTAAAAASKEAQDALMASMREQGVVIREDLIKAYDSLFAQEKHLNALLDSGRISMQAHAQKTKLNAEALQGLNAKALAAGYSMSKLKDEVKGSTDAMDPAAAAADKLADTYARLGLVMKDDLTTAIKKNEEALRLQADATGYASDEYLIMENALNADVAALQRQYDAQLQSTDATKAGAESLGSLSTGADAAAKSLDLYRTSADGAASSIGKAAAATDRLAASQENLSSWDTGKLNFGGGVSGGTFTRFTPISEFTSSQWATYTALTGTTRSMWQAEQAAGGSQWA